MQLVINTPGTFIAQKDECFRLKQQERQFDVSPLKVESLVIPNPVMISTQAVVMALEHNIDVIFLDAYGDPVERIWFSQSELQRLSPLLILDFLSSKDAHVFVHSSV